MGSEGATDWEEDEGEEDGGGASSGDEGGADPAAQTAWEVGLNGAGLVEEEVGLLPPGADEATYVRVRGGR